MNILDGLNKEQKEAVLYNDGPLLVFAGAGSGKTRILTKKIAFLIENGIGPENILAITFTNKAANEMKERVKEMVGDKVNDMWICTFHSMCVRILRKYASYIGYADNFTIYDVDDAKSLLRKIIKDLGYDSSKITNSVYYDISSYKSNGCDGDIGSCFFAYDIKKIYEEYQDAMFMSNCMDFDDLLLNTKELLENNFDVQCFYQDLFKYVLVDEYQDTNKIQLDLIKLMINMEDNICVVGDDSQSIYVFRGADFKNILNFSSMFAGTKEIKMEQNYRSTKTILNAANAVISNNKVGVSKTLWTENEEGKKIDVIKGINQKDEAEKVIVDIMNSEFDYSDIVILYRNNRQSRLLEESCIRHNVPYKIISGVNFYQRKEIKDIIAYLKFIYNPKDITAFERIINTPKRGVGDLGLQKIIDYANLNKLNYYEVLNEIDKIKLPSKVKDKIKEFANIISNFKKYISVGKDLSFAVKYLYNKIKYEDEIRAISSDPEEIKLREENIEELINKISELEDHAHKNGEKLTLEKFLENVALISDVKEENGSYIRLMTIHASKGLEFKKVYVIGMNNFIFPSGNLFDMENIEEERRLCYVAITRAMKELTFSYSSEIMNRGFYTPSQKSIFLSEIPNKYLNIL